MRTDPDGIVRESSRSPYSSECIEFDSDGRCEGEEIEELSTTGATSSIRCRKHRAAYEDRMQKVEADIQSRYPNYDIPGSMPPPGFDPAYAGESWDENY